MEENNPTTELLNILSKAMDNKTYGSVEVYLEEGHITQITQRIIKKIHKTKTHKVGAKKKTNISAPNQRRDISVKYPD